jgi:hypothetical protein
MECIKNKKRGRNQPLFCSGEQDRTAHLRVMNPAENQRFTVFTRLFTPQNEPQRTIIHPNAPKM